MSDRDAQIKAAVGDHVSRYFAELDGQLGHLRERHRAEVEALERDYEKYRLRVRRQIATRLLAPVVMGFVLLAVLAAGGWGLAQWSGYRLRTSVAALAEVEDRITAAELEWAELRDGSWGVGLIEIDGQCYVLVPEDADAETFVRIDGRRAVRVPCRGSGE